MRLEYKRLSSGYHYVRDLDSHHVFAQWPIGRECEAEDVSAIPLTYSCAAFAEQAQRFAEQRITGVREVKLGRFYLVSSVRVEDWRGFSGWLPILGPKHEDADVIKFPWTHFHVDWRFASERVFRYYSVGRYGASSGYGAPISCPNRDGRQVVFEGPVLRRMKYKRAAPPYPVDAAKWLDELSAKYACAKLINGVCPHRGIPVDAMIRDGDILTCPGHGLQWNATTGALHSPTHAVGVSDGQ